MFRLETVLDRLYIVGDTFPIKDELRAAGARWCGARRQWWVAPDEAQPVRNVLEACATKAGVKAENLDEYDVIAHCEYKGKPYYVIGQAKGRQIRLCNPTAQYAFWTDWNNCTNFRKNEPPAEGSRPRPDDDLTTVGEYRAASRAYHIAYADNDKEGVRCPRCDDMMPVDEPECPTCGNTTQPYADDVPNDDYLTRRRSPFDQHLREEGDERRLIPPPTGKDHPAYRARHAAAR